MVLTQLANTSYEVVRDVFPVLALLVGFQVFVLRRPVPHLRKLIVGMVCVLAGLTLFLMGLETALFPVGKIMARQLSSPEFTYGAAVPPEQIHWWSYGWVFLFAGLIGFSTTIAEPALIAVAFKASEVSRGSISEWGLRVTVAVGVAIGIGLGTFRIVTGTPLHMYIIAGYIIVVILTIFAPRSIIPLAYDSGGVTTSTVTVPLVAALGLGLAETIPGRNAALDGFGLIAFASVFPMVTVMSYAQLAAWRTKRRERARQSDKR